MLATGRATSGRLGRARALLENHETPTTPTRAVGTGMPSVDRVLPHGGLGLGQTHEFLAVDPPLTILAAFAARALTQPTSACVWIGFAPTPHLLATTLGEHWSRRCLIVTPTSDNQRLWAADQALRCPAVSAVVADASRFAPAATRRLQLAAEQTDVLALFARPMRERTTRSACTTRWLIEPTPHDTPAWTLTLARCRGAQLADPPTWPLTWRQPTDDAPPALALAPELVDRPLPTTHARTA